MVSVEKWNGTGNDFVIVPGTAPIEDEAHFTKHVCDRETGLDDVHSRKRGADGVLFLTLHDGTPPRVEMHHVQPDGSTPAMCGNGVRCAAQWALNRTEAESVIVEPPAGPHPATPTADGIEIEMQQPRFAPAAVPLNRPTPLVAESLGGFDITAVSTGVPHAVAFVDDIADYDLSEVAPPIRHHDIFPEGANVTLAEWVGETELIQRTYERGVEAETDACGTGAVAIGAAAVRTQRVAPGTTLSIQPPGGTLAVTVDEEQVLMAGPVEREFETTLEATRRSVTPSPTD
ncbi:diaminopimelate epimerase [Halosegnis longus]|uniref:diaminopimelate epimerase n=1 Tax=Halosegnis longus TaxID=2216012 RepID=UPI00129DCE31|nr:diaminopimelate epimerase [Halosegnis longus]